MDKERLFDEWYTDKNMEIDFEVFNHDDEYLGTDKVEIDVDKFYDWVIEKDFESIEDLDELFDDYCDEKLRTEEWVNEQNEKLLEYYADRMMDARVRAYEAYVDHKIDEALGK